MSRPKIKFDWTLNLGTVLQMLLLASVLVGAYIRWDARLVSVETKVAIMFDWWQKNVK